jgi:hypothetical protein
VRFLKELRKQELPSPAELRRLASEVRARQRSD